MMKAQDPTGRVLPRLTDDYRQSLRSRMETTKELRHYRKENRHAPVEHYYVDANGNRLPNSEATT